MSSAYEENGLPGIGKKNKDVRIVTLGNDIKSREIIDKVIDDMESITKSEAMARGIEISRLKSLINSTPDLSMDGMKNKTFESELSMELRMREKMRNNNNTEKL